MFAILQAYALWVLRDHGTSSGSIVPEEYTHDIVSVTACGSFGEGRNTVTHACRAKPVVRMCVAICQAGRCSPLVRVPPTRFFERSRAVPWDFLYSRPTAFSAIVPFVPSLLVCNRGVIALHTTRITRPSPARCSLRGRLPLRGQLATSGSDLRWSSYWAGLAETTRVATTTFALDVRLTHVQHGFEIAYRRT